MTAMTLPETALAIALLLLTPGPTNTLVALAAAERGFARALRLIPAELAGYLAAVVPLALAGPWLVQHVPGAATSVTAAAALWVAVLATRLWRLPVQHRAASVTAAQVLLTTFLNPKALVFGLVLLPGDGLTQRLALFVGLVVAVAAFWAAIGAGGLGAAGHSALIRRGAAVWLGLLSALLAARAFAG